MSRRSRSTILNPDGRRRGYLEIILARHGETTPLPKTPISGKDLGKWVALYNATGITADVAAPVRLRQAAAAAPCVIASDLRRSVESARVLVSPEKILIDPDLREATLPDSMGLSLRLRPGAWMVIARVAWLLRWRSSSETVGATRQRASRAADRLWSLAETHGTVLVVAHRTFNKFLATQLLGRGWRGPRFWSGRYWASATFKRAESARDSAGRLRRDMR